MTDPAAEPHDSMIDVINAYKKDVDRTLLRENLRLSVDERIRKFESVWEYAAEIRAAGERSRTTRRKNGAKLP